MMETVTVRVSMAVTIVNESRIQLTSAMEW